ncbi:MAG: hypothetical protein JSU82_03440 [Rhodospirillales bacterium]|nr:MAG: hypothetical protein JSU82_03440 [Rhodospirillales bacterium]
MNGQKQQPAPGTTAAKAAGQLPLAVKILLALGGFASLAIALEGARTWSWWASAVLSAWNIGGTPVAPELFIYPAFFTMVLTLSRPPPGADTGRFLATGLLWSAALFLADPALRAAVNAVTPAAAETGAAETLRGTLLYGLLFAWMYLTFRHLIPRGKGPLAEPEADVDAPDAREGAGEGKAAR